MVSRKSKISNRSRDHGRVLFDTPTTFQRNTSVTRPLHLQKDELPRTKIQQKQQGNTQHFVEQQGRSAELGHVVLGTSTAVHKIYWYGGEQFYLPLSTNSFSLRDWINEHDGRLPPRLHVGKFILQLLHSSPLRLDKRTCLEITNFCVSDVGSTKPTSFSETLGAGGAPCCTASSPPSPIHSGATMSSILLVSWQRLVRSCPNLIRPLCTNASTIRTSQTMRRIFVACQNPRLSAVSPALNHAASSSSEAIHESCNASIYTAPWTFRTSCSALTHSQCVCCVVCCVLMCFGAVWCVLMCCVVLRFVGSCRVVSWRCVRVRVRVRVCVCERVEECLVCGVMSCGNQRPA